MSIKYALERNSDSSLRKEILANTYVDNLLIGARNASDAIAKQRQCKDTFAAMGMNLREFMSNYNAVMDRIPAKDRMQWTTGTTVKLLGVRVFAAAAYLVCKPPQQKPFSHLIYAKAKLAAPADGSIRSVAVKLGSQKVLNRSVNQLISLEVAAEDKDSIKKPTPRTPTRIQPPRKAKKQFIR
ncbi:unnamed protein product [Heligmosomoides polygyrus]|uniref:Uncharacterized protein n=1 Tax=Heligmosomoides polygyrus TaxID=6339 RepID=A0A183GQX7_HELPZ|nr:unnamed protein product [Heligmosomoides polygyrus]